MSIDIEKYKNQEAITTLTGNPKYDNDSWLYKSGVVPLVARVFLSTFRWYFWKYMFYLALCVIGVGIANRDKIATQLAYDNYGGALKLLAEDQGIKSSLTNHHPAYQSEYAWKLKEEIGWDLKKLYWFYEIDGMELLVQRDITRRGDVERYGTSNEPYKLEKSTWMGQDAVDFCASMYGWLPPTKDFLDEITGRLHIKKYDGPELTGSDNSGDEKAFRCIINAEAMATATEE